jgi:plastocyanin
LSETVNQDHGSDIIRPDGREIVARTREVCDEGSWERSGTNACATERVEACRGADGDVVAAADRSAGLRGATVRPRPRAEHAIEDQTEAGGAAADSSAVPAAPVATRPQTERTTHPEASATEPSTRVVLTSKGCVEFEPNWTTIRVGQSLSWRSELKTPVTIHVTSGVFDHAQYVVKPGALVHTNPAHSPGSYSIWTEPAACQTAPTGVQGPGPGLKVEAATQR